MYLPCNTEKSTKFDKKCIGGTISYLPRNTENIAQQVQFRTCRAIRKILQSRYKFVPAVQYGKNCTGGTISYLTCNHKGYLQKPCLQNDCTKAALFPTCWRGGKQACLLGYLVAFKPRHMEPQGCKGSPIAPKPSPKNTAPRGRNDVIASLS